MFSWMNKTHLKKEEVNKIKQFKFIAKYFLPHHLKNSWFISWLCLLQAKNINRRKRSHIMFAENIFNTKVSLVRMEFFDKNDSSQVMGKMLTFRNLEMLNWMTDVTKSNILVVNQHSTTAILRSRCSTCNFPVSEPNS